MARPSAHARPSSTAWSSSVALLGAATLAAACFAPDYPTGIPCSEAQTCPPGQVCDPATLICSADPVPVPDPQRRALRMAVAMRERVRTLAQRWQKLGFELDFGIGLAEGYATLGAIGFEGRWDYGAIGTVTNLAARLCGEARGGQILISRRLYAALESLIDVEPLGELTLKGFARPVTAFNVLGTRATS